MAETVRFTQVPQGRGHYESFYLKACPPGGGRGLWIRYTIHKRPNADPNASVWFTWFDRQADLPAAAKLTFQRNLIETGGGDWIRVGESRIGPGIAEGRLSVEALTASWKLEVGGEEPPCPHLPADWMYRTPLPKTKFVVPRPLATFDGSLELDGRKIELDGWRGMIGHNWGTEHAERWVWLEGAGFAGSPDTWFDAGAARIRLAGWNSPWIPFGTLSLDGERHRLGGLGRVRHSRIKERYDGCEFELPGRNILVRGRVSAPAKDFVAWMYADPKGPPHHTINCSAADLELEIERPGRPARQLSLPGAGAYELGMRETGHGVPIQPFPDG